MKKKLSSILGVGLALVLVFSLVAGFGFTPANTPEAEAATVTYTANQWNELNTPGAIGNKIRICDVTAFVMANDSTTVYAVDRQSLTGSRILKSDDGGIHFWTLNNPGAPYDNAPKLVAVAPDNPDVVAIVDGNNAVFISTTGGSTWSNVAAGTTGWGADESITAIAVGPERAGCILERDYIVCTADTTNSDGTGNVYVVGASSTWKAQGGTTAEGAVEYDYTSLIMAPNWLGNRSFIAVASNAVGTYYQVTEVSSPWTNLCNKEVKTALTVSPTCANIVSSSVAVPSDMDTSSALRRGGYVGLNGGADDDVYRMDNPGGGFGSVFKLGLGDDLEVRSISYSGTFAGGTLFAALDNSTMIWHSENPTVCCPNWIYNFKSPTGASVATTMISPVGTTVQAAPDFQETGKVYAGTTGTNSAFSRSTNKGFSYNQISLIDNPQDVIFDVMPSPDNSVVFLSTDNTGVNGIGASLWRSTTSPTAISWERVLFQTTNNGYIIRLSPYYSGTEETDSTLYFCDVGGTDIQVSNNTGEIYNAGTTAPATIIDVAVESKSVVYVADAGNVRKSTNGASAFGLPKNADVGGNVYSIAMAPSYPNLPVPGNILCGGIAGEVSLSTDSGASFGQLLATATTGNMQVLGDVGYAENDIVFCADDGTNAIYRYTVGASAAWEQIRAAQTAGDTMSGLAMNKGLLYGSWDNTNAPSGAERGWTPWAPQPLPLWDQMDVGSTTAAFNRAPSALRIGGGDGTVWLYAIDTIGTDALYGYNDSMADQVVEVTVKPEMVPYDTATDMNSQFNVEWTQVSNAMCYQFAIFGDEACTHIVWTPLAAVFPGMGMAPCVAWYFPSALPVVPTLVVPAGTLSAGHDYWIKVKVRNEVPGDAIRSAWSAPAKFTVEAGVPIEVPYPSPQILGPLPGSTGVSVTPGFAWGGFHGAQKYEFELGTSPSSTAGGYFIDALVAKTGANALVDTAWQCDITLGYSTNYYWHVKAITATGSTPWSTSVFTTMSAEEIPGPPVPPVELPAPVTPAWIWAIVIIGAVLVIVVIVLIVVTRRQ